MHAHAPCARCRRAGAVRAGQDWPAQLRDSAAEGQYVRLERLNLLDNILTHLPVEARPPPY